MSPILSAILSFLFYWLVMYVATYVIAEYAQNYLYDEATPALGWKVAAGTFLLSILLTRFRPSFETMFTADIGWTILQAIAWTAVFVFIYQFHPPHAVLLGVVSFVLLSGLTTLALDSFNRTGTAASARREVIPQAKPQRRPAFAPGPPPAGKAEPAKTP
jgi:hypothetical protein